MLVNSNQKQRKTEKTEDSGTKESYWSNYVKESKFKKIFKLKRQFFKTIKDNVTQLKNILGQTSLPPPPKKNPAKFS